MEDGGVSISSKFIIETLLDFDLSVRARSALELLKCYPQWNEWTFRDYLLNRGRFSGALLRIPNIGRTTVDEIHKVALKLVTQNSEDGQSGERSGEASACIISEVSTAGADIPFFNSLKQVELSVRLRNVLVRAEREYQGEPTVQDYLDENSGFYNFIRARRNLGRKSLREMANAVDGLLPGNEMTSPLGSVNITLQAPSIPTSHCDDQETVGLLPHSSEPPLLPAEAITRVLCDLNERETEIIKRRNGLDGGVVETLEQIGFDFGVTRERIRQLEKKAFGRLTVGSRRRRIKQSVDFYSFELWNELGGKGGVLLMEGDDKANRAFSSENYLSIKVAYGAVSKWLDEYAVPADFGWFLNDDVRRECEDLSSTLLQGLTGRSLPLPLSTVLPEGHNKYLATYVIYANKMSEFLGYVFSGTAGVRKRRTIYLHYVLSRSWPEFISLHELVDVYRRQQSTDQCSERDARIVMERAPHLFLHVLENRWSAIGPNTNNDFDEDVSSDQLYIDLNEDDDEPLPESGSIATTLERLLDDVGPSRFVDLRRAALKLLPEGTSPASFGPILLTNGSFTRAAPGLYALPHQLDDVISGKVIPEGMLAVDQCRWFVQAFRAGGIYGDFPAWTSQLELELCRWAEDEHIDHMLYESLLAIIRPELWNASVGERDYWSRAKARTGVYRLDQPVPDLTETIPPLERILAVTQKVVVDGGVNWITVNRILGKRVDHAGAATTLALLVKFEIVSPPKNWQDYHHKAGRADNAFSLLSEKHGCDGSLDWSNIDVFDTLLVGHKSPDRETLGWVFESNVDEIISMVSDEGGICVEHEKEEPDPDSLDSLLALRRNKRRDEVLCKISGQQAGERRGTNMPEGDSK